MDSSVVPMLYFNNQEKQKTSYEKNSMVLKSFLKEVQVTK